MFMYEHQAHSLPFKSFSINVALTSHSKIRVQFQKKLAADFSECKSSLKMHWRF